MKRIIFVNNIEDIDYSNVGVHFTENHSYNHVNGGANGTTQIKRYKVTFEVESASINADATAVSREEYPKEKEVVLQKNQALTANVVISDRETGYFVGNYMGEKKQINTGTRCDKWAEKYF